MEAARRWERMTKPMSLESDMVMDKVGLGEILVKYAALCSSVKRILFSYVTENLLYSAYVAKLLKRSSEWCMDIGIFVRESFVDLVAEETCLEHDAASINQSLFI